MCLRWYFELEKDPFPLQYVFLLENVQLLLFAGVLQSLVQNAVRKHQRLPEEKHCTAVASDQENNLHEWEKLNCDQWVHARLRSCRSYLDQRLAYIKIARHLYSALALACVFGKQFYSLIRYNKFLKLIFVRPSQIEENYFLNCYF